MGALSRTDVDDVDKFRVGRPELLEGQFVIRVSGGVCVNGSEVGEEGREEVLEGQAGGAEELKEVGGDE